MKGITVVCKLWCGISAKYEIGSSEEKPDRIVEYSR